MRSGAPLATPVVLSVTDNVGVTNARAAATRFTNAASAGASAKMCTSPLAPAAMASSAPWRGADVDDRELAALLRGLDRRAKHGAVDASAICIPYAAPSS